MNAGKADGWNRSGGKGWKAKGDQYSKGLSGKAMQSKGKAKGFEDRDCWYCGKRGHLSRNCPAWHGKGVYALDGEDGTGFTQEDETQQEYEEVDWMAACIFHDECTTEACGNRDEHHDSKCLGFIGHDALIKDKAKLEGNRFQALSTDDDDDCEICPPGILNTLEDDGIEYINTLGEDRWEKFEGIMDSGAVDNVAPETAFPWIPLTVHEDARVGKYYVTASGKKVYVLGVKNRQPHHDGRHGKEDQVSDCQGQENPHQCIEGHRGRE